MAIQIQGKVVRLPDGSEAGPYEIVSGLSPAQEAALIQGGDAVAAGARGLVPAFYDVSGASPVLLDPSGNPASVSGGGTKRRSTISAFIPLMPTFTFSASVITHNALMTAPGHFDAVALFAINVEAAVNTIDGACVAVTERSDTSKTVPIIGGTNYNALAAAGTQKGFIPVTWSGASSTTIAAGSLTRPTLQLSDWVPLSSVDRVDGGSLPLVIARSYYNNRTFAAFQFSSAAQQDAFSEGIAPLEFNHVSQTGVDGVSNPAALTTAWSAGANTTVCRIFGMAFRLRGTGELIAVFGDSIDRGLGAGGDTSTNNADNTTSWALKAAAQIASVTAPVGIICAGISGQTSTQYLQRAKDMMTLIRPSVAVYPPYSPNDTPNTDAANSAEIARALDFMDVCLSTQTTPVLRSPVPYTGAGTEARRQAFITKVATLRGATVLDPNVTGVYDASASGTAYWAAGASNADRTHYTAAGRAALVSGAAVPLFATVTR